MKRIMVYGDSNSWGYPADGSGVRMAERWPVIMGRHMDGVEVIEENLPGRTTVHDDAEHMGETNNGLRFLETALRSHAPLDAVVILLGTNDLKARFQPSAKRIADNVGTLVEKARNVGGGSVIWDEPTPPRIFVLCPPPLSERAIDPAWERVEEWAGGRKASEGLWEAMQDMGQVKEIAVFNTENFVEGGAEDPIHWTAASHLRLGQAVAHWLSTHGL